MTAVEFLAAERLSTDTSTPGRWIASHLRPNWWLIPVMVVGALGNAALAGVLPVIVGEAFDVLSAGPSQRAAEKALLNAALLIILSQTVRAVLQLGRNFASEVLAQRFEREARSELFASLLGKSMTFHGKRPTGEVMARVTNDVREVNLMLNPGMNLVVGSGTFLIIPILFAPRYHPSLVVVPIAFTVLYMWALRRYLRQLEPITREVRSSFGVMNARLTEAVDGIEVVKGASLEEEEEKRFGVAAAAFRDATILQGDKEARFLPLLLMGIAIGVGFLQSLVLYQRGLLSVGDVVAYAGLLQLFAFPTFVSLFAYSQVSAGIASASRILELMRDATSVDQNVAGHDATMAGSIDFRDVTFGYQEGEPILTGISFTVSPGQTVAIVGETGSGKSSLTRLVNRTFDADRGSVLVDGLDVRAWHIESLRRQIAIIEQDPFLFSRSVAENIAFGRPDAEREAIVRAAEDAQAHEFIKELPEGYDTVIGERGVTLSGGQRQRIAIARALLADPRILILDDATSAIDSATEDAIQRAMWRAAEGRTTLLITHRLSQIRWADLILVLRKGELADCGSHEELMARSRAYQRIFKRYEPDDPWGASADV